MSWCVQVHGACGAKQSVVAVGQLHLQDLLSEGKSQERLHGTVTLVGTGDHLGVPFGIVTFWSHLRCPMEHAVQVYRVSYNVAILSSKPLAWSRYSELVCVKVE